MISVLMSDWDFDAESPFFAGIRSIFGGAAAMYDGMSAELDGSSTMLGGLEIGLIYLCPKLATVRGP